MNTTRNSVQWIALRLCALMGVTNFDPQPVASTSDPTSEPGVKSYLAEGDLDTLAGVISGALQEMWDDAPACVSEKPSGGSLFAPTPLLLAPIQGVLTAVSNGPLPAGINGCSVLIPGDGFVNEIVSTNTPVITLRRPYLGATPGALVQATVFGNAVPIPAGTKNVLEPVETMGGRQLYGCGDRAEFDALSGCYLYSTQIQAGWPSRYFVETAFNAAANTYQTFLRVTPAPAQAMPITFRTKVIPPTITVAQLGTSDADPGFIPPVPGGYVESILLPYCLQRFTGTALFKNETARAEIQRQYLAAKNRLASFRPSVGRQRGAYAYAV